MGSQSIPVHYNRRSYNYNMHVCREILMKLQKRKSRDAPKTMAESMHVASRECGLFSLEVLRWHGRFGYASINLR